MKRKLISLLLLVIMLASQFSVVFAEEGRFPTTGGAILLSDYLINHGLDEDEDGTLSDAEWAKVKRLNLENVDVTGIEKAINLKCLEMFYCENVSTIDFSKLTKLEEVRVDGYIGELNISNLSNATTVKSLYIVDTDVSKLDFSKFTKLESLYISYSVKNDVDLSGIAKATNLNNIDIFGYLNNSISNIDFSKLQKLESLAIHNNDNEICVDLSKISNATNLEYLSIHRNCNISTIDFSKLINLKELFCGVDGELDFSNISLASNLIRLDISDCQKLTNIDFSKLSKLEYMYIDTFYGGIEELTFPVINSLTNLYIHNYNSNSFEKINLSNLNNLKELSVSSHGTKTLILPKFRNLENIDIECVYWDNGEQKITDYEIDLENCANIYGDILINSTEKLKLNNNTVIYDATNYALDLPAYKLDGEINDFSICKGFLSTELLEFNNVTCEENNILEIEKDEQGCLIKPNNIGTQKVSYYDVLGRKHDVNVTVFEIPNNNIDKELEDSDITSEIVDYDLILKSNGELWEINSDTTAEKIDTNVKDYDWGEAYTWQGYIMTIKNKLKFDNTLTIDIDGLSDYDDLTGEASEIAYTKTVSNVKEIGKNLYLTNDGDLFEILYNYITDEINLKKVKENVKRLIGDCIVLEDGTTWCQDKSANEMEGIYDKIQEFYKVADFEIKDAGWYTHEGTDYWSIVDLNSNLYGFDSYYGWLLQYNNDDYSTEMTLLKENFEDYYSDSNVFMWYSYTLEDEDVYDFYKVDERDVILSNVTRQDYYYGDTETDILIRTDGTIWTYSDRYGLTKITKSTVIDGEEDDENKPFLSENSKIKEKEMGEKTVISGVSKNLTVQEFNNQNNFSDGYQAKVFDKSNKEITGNAILGTGSKVRLYDDNKLVKEYVVVIYGDTTGDGKITAVDALALIKHINNKILFTDEVFSEAGRVRPNTGTTLTSVDALAIIKGVNGKFTINQYK